MNKPTSIRQIGLERRSPSYWRVTFDLPPLNIFGPLEVPKLETIIKSIEKDEHVKVVVFDSAIEGFFLTHYDFLAKLEETTSLPFGTTGLQPLPDSELDEFVDALATRIASFDKQAIADTKRLVDISSLPSDAEIEPEWGAFISSLQRPATQARIDKLMELGFHKPGDVETRLGYYVGQLGNQ